MPCTLRGAWRRGWDLNPRLLSGEPLFESGALSHSATSPLELKSGVLSSPACRQAGSSQQILFLRFTHRLVSELLTPNLRLIPVTFPTDRRIRNL
jgi:hypothetical protein